MKRETKEKIVTAFCVGSVVGFILGPIGAIVGALFGWAAADYEARRSQS